MKRQNGNTVYPQRFEASYYADEDISARIQCEFDDCHWIRFVGDYGRLTLTLTKDQMIQLRAEINRSLRQQLKEEIPA